MAIPTKDWDLPAGDTVPVSVRAVRSDGTTPIVGATVTLTIATTPAITKASGATDSTGSSSITLAPADTKNITPGHYAYDLVAVEGDGTRSTILTGTVSIVDHPNKG